MSEIPQVELSEDDWREVYYALDAHARRIEQGEYGPCNAECNTKAWAGQLRGIMEQIAERVEV